MALLFAAPWSARADVITIPASRDTTLYEQSGAKSNGAGEYLFAGINNRGERRRALVAFDVAMRLPPGTVVTAAELRLFQSRGQQGAVTVSLHRVRAGWSEGTSDAAGNEGQGSPASILDATWSNRVWNTVPWE
ncbi:MAG: DNRLRE domain-containing protein, partial [Deltaproteobacteria bacterium]|nr:DNRLRE domain-containing protein [Deltaproteobacteria bacterium]